VVWCGGHRIEQKSKKQGDSKKKKKTRGGRRCNLCFIVSKETSPTKRLILHKIKEFIGLTWQVFRSSSRTKYESIPLMMMMVITMALMYDKMTLVYLVIPQDMLIPNPNQTDDAPVLPSCLPI